MEMERSENENAITFDIHGSLTGTVQSAMHFFESISMTLENCEKDILIDMKKLMFIDSMAIGLLVGILLKCKEKGVSAKLINVPEHIKKVFESANLDRAFPEMF